MPISRYCWICQKTVTHDTVTKISDYNKRLGMMFIAVNIKCCECNKETTLNAVVHDLYVSPDVSHPRYIPQQVRK